MVVGEIGTGKSTLLNSMINYAYGVRLDDDFRFKIVTQDHDGKESAKSRTNTVTAYSLYNTKLRDGNGAPYILTVVDTPGYGDTEGLSADKNTTKIIKELFETRPPKGITSLNAIILVVKSNDSKLTAHQRHNFNSVLALFGKNLSGSILIAATFCDGGDPPVKRTLPESKITSRNFFKFNNSVVFTGPSNNHAWEQTSRAMFWAVGDASFDALFHEINMMKEVSLQQSVEVLLRRENLELLVIQLQCNLRLGMKILDQMRTDGMLMEKFEAEITANKDFTYTAMEPCIEKKQLAPGLNTTTCLVCSMTCHKICPFKDDSDRWDCAAMDGNGNCRICPGKCSWAMHKNMPFIFEDTYKEVTLTNHDLKKKYEDAYNKFTDKESMMENLAEQFGRKQMEIAGIVKHIKDSLAELKKIAHKPIFSFPTEPEYIDLLILEGEKMDHRPGWQTRVELLQEQRQIALQIQSVQDPNFDPFAEYKNYYRDSGWLKYAEKLKLWD